MNLPNNKPLPASPLPPKPYNPLPVWLALVLLLLYLIVWHLDISFEALAYGIEDMAEYFSRYGQPDFSHLSSYLQLMGVDDAGAPRCNVS